MYVLLRGSQNLVDYGLMRHSQVLLMKAKYNSWGLFDNTKGMSSL